MGIRDHSESVEMLIERPLPTTQVVAFCSIYPFPSPPAHDTPARLLSILFLIIGNVKRIAKNYLYRKGALHYYITAKLLALLLWSSGERLVSSLLVPVLCKLE